MGYTQLNIHPGLKSRKVIGGILLIILATLLIFVTDISADLFEKWGNFVMTIYGLYVVGNVGQKFSERPVVIKKEEQI